MNITLSMNLNVNNLLTLLFVIIELLGIIGNLLVIVSICIDSRMRISLTNRLIVHIGCCDLLILLFNIPDLIQFFLSINGNWILNEISCKLIRTILVLAQYSSVLTMCILTIERFIGIVYPLRSKLIFEKKHLREMLIFIWIFSLIFALPNLFYLRLIQIDSSKQFCQLEYSKESFLLNKRYYIIHKAIESTIFYFIPLLIQIYSYLRIGKQLFYVDQLLLKQFTTKNPKTQNNISDEDDEDYILTKRTIKQSPNGFKKNEKLNKSSSKMNSIKKIRRIENVVEKNERNVYSIHCKTLKSRRSVIKMLIVVVIIYFISFSPQVIVFLFFETNLIKKVPKFVQTHYFIAFTMLLVTISSAANPFVYVIFSSKFRQSFANIFRYLCFCSSTNSLSSTNPTSTSIQNLQKSNYHYQKRFINKNISIQLNQNNNL